MTEELSATMTIRRTYSEYIASVNDYKILETLSKDGDTFGKVELVETKKTDETVEIRKYAKIELAPRQIDFTRQIDLFVHTAPHRALIKFEAFIYLPNHLAIVEYISNKSLAHILRDLKRGTRHPEWQGTMKMKCVYGICAAIVHLNCCSQNPFSHTYLCPQNIMFDTKNEPILINYVFGNIENRFKMPTAYIPPELQNDPNGPRDDMDVWCFGMILYEILVGHEPYQGLSDAQIKAEILAGHIPELPPPSNDTDFLCGIIQNCLEKNPTDRPLMYHVMDFLHKLNSSIFADTDMAAYDDYRNLTFTSTILTPEVIAYMAENKDQGSDKNENIMDLIDKADSGDAYAQIRVGRMYQKGIGIEMDEEKAFAYFQKAANLNNPIGLYNASLCLLKGRGCEKDERKCAQLMKKAVDLDFSLAFPTYADLLIKGIGMKADPRAAVDLLKKGSERDLSECQYSLGLMYYEGTDYLRKDIAEGLRYFERAARNGNSTANNDRGYHALNVEKDIGKAINLYKRAVNQKNVTAMINLARCYLQLEGEDRDDNKAQAAKYFKMAAEKNDINGICEYANCLKNGIGLAKNEINARHYYETAANSGNARAQHNYARMLQLGQGGDVNLKKADEYFKKAADQGVPPSAYYHGKMLMEGSPEHGIVRNLRDARRYLAIAAKSKFEDSVELLARLSSP